MRNNFEFNWERGCIIYPEKLDFPKYDASKPTSLTGWASGNWIMATGNPINISGEVMPVEQCFQKIAEAAIQGNIETIAEYDGPFLVVVINAKNRKISIVRDKYGLRSVYYSFSDRKIVVNDDVSTFDVRQSLRSGSLNEWLHYGAPLSPHSFFDKIKVIPAGCVVNLDMEQWQLECVNYFLPERSVSVSQYLRLENLSASSAKIEFSRIFGKSIERAVSGHERVTLLLSGGVDSSLLAAYARKNTIIDAVTVDIYGDKTETEVEFAKSVANKLNISLNAVRFGRKEFLENICHTIADTAAPIIVENAVALNYAARAGFLPKNQLIIDGEGADALMGGSTSLFKYSYSLLHLKKAYGVNASMSRRVIELLRLYLSKIGLQTISTLDVAGLDVGLSARNIEVQALTARLLGVFGHVRSREEQEISALMMREFYDYLVPLMIRIDRMGKIANANIVLPYLLEPVFDFLVNLNSDHRFGARGALRRPVTKLLLKSVLSDEIGDELVYRPKVGFGIPANLWMKLPVSWCNDLWVAEYFKVPNSLLTQWINSCTTRDKLFIISMEIWARIFVRQISLVQVHNDWIEGQSLRD